MIRALMTTRRASIKAVVAVMLDRAMSLGWQAV